jgi:hypothetical protein
VESTAKIKQAMEAMGMKAKVDMDFKTVNRYTVKKAARDGVVLEAKVETVDVKTDGPGGEEIEKFMKLLRGALFAVTLDRNGKITRYEGYAEHIRKIAKEDKQQAKMFQALLTEDALRQEPEDLFEIGPDKAVAKGGRWQKKQRVSLGAVGSLKAVSQFTYQGKSKEGEQIDVTATLTYLPPQGGDGLPFKITKGDLKAASYKGKIWFDQNRSRVARVRIMTTIKGNLTAEVMNQTVEMSLEQSSVGTVRVLDRSPSDD